MPTRFILDDVSMSAIDAFRAGLCAANPALKGSSHTLVFDAIIDELRACNGRSPTATWRKAAVVAIGLINDYVLIEKDEVAPFFAFIDFATGFEDLL